MNGGAVEVRHLRALVALTEEGTFTDAAARLGVTQSAVSRLITAFEDAVDVQLVRRTTRSVALTGAGTRCYHAAVRALAALDDVAGAARGPARALRLGYTWAALGRHTTDVLQRWRTGHPDVPLEVHRVDDRDGGLSSGVADLAVIRGAVELPGLRSERVFREARVAAVALGNPLAAQASVTLAELAGQPILTAGNGTTTLELWPVDHRPRSVLQVDNLDEWLTEIAGGLAAGVTTEATAQLHGHPGIRFLPLTGAPPVDVHLAWPQRVTHPSTAAFVRLVAEVVQAPTSRVGSRG